MWLSRLFWKLFLTYAVLILATAGLFALLVSTTQERQVLENLRHRLYDNAVLLRSHVQDDLESGQVERVKELTRGLGRETGTRMTLIAASGMPLADSEYEAADMEPHGDRPEIVLARETGLGVATHLSRTIGIPMMYLALRVDEGDRLIGYVRVALPMRDVQATIAATRRQIWGIALGVGLATLVVTYWAVARIAKPLRSLTEAAEAIASGTYGHKVYVPNRDELGSLSEAFNRMSGDLAERVSQIRRDQELLATVLGGMVEGVVAVDGAQRILFANGAARSLLGLPSGDLAGRPLWELVRHPAVHQAIEDAFAREQPSRSEFEIAGPVRRVVVLHAGRLHGDPSTGVVLVLHDVSDLRRLETLRRDFVANVSHELKTPLASIKAYAETLLDGAISDPESNRQFVAQIEEQANRLHALILDLLSLARIESGQEAFEIESLPVASLVEACTAQHESTAASKRLSLVVRPWEAPLRIRADEEGVREILNNLLDNAVKYTLEGGHVTVRWRPDDSMCLLEVEDSGIGIPAHELGRIFERFHRVDKARSRELGGTGLGLSIVKHLAQAFGGSVAVTSEVGRGSTFSVRLPLA